MSTIKAFIRYGCPAIGEKRDHILRSFIDRADYERSKELVSDRLISCSFSSIEDQVITRGAIGAIQKRHDLITRLDLAGFRFDESKKTVVVPRDWTVIQ